MFEKIPLCRKICIYVYSVYKMYIYDDHFKKILLKTSRVCMYVVYQQKPKFRSDIEWDDFFFIQEKVSKALKVLNEIFKSLIRYFR